MRCWFICLLILNGVMLSNLIAAPRQMYVQVRNCQVREASSHLAPLAGVLEPGMEVSVLGSEGGWHKVQAGDTLEGWIHSSSLHRRQVKMDAGDEDVDVSASSGEMVLATKGFSAETEQKFRERNASLCFEWVDKMESTRVSEEELLEFIQAGTSAQQEGDQ